MTTPEAVVADIVSPKVKMDVALVNTNSMIEIVPNFLVVILDTNAVLFEIVPVIVNPLKLKYCTSYFNWITISCDQFPADTLRRSVFGNEKSTFSCPYKIRNKVLKDFSLPFER